MPTGPIVGGLMSPIQWTLLPVPPSQPLDVSQLLTQAANHLSLMQAIVAILAIVVGLVTVVVTIIGLIFAYVGNRAQREAKQAIEEIKQDLAKRHTENKDYISDRHSTHKVEIHLQHKVAQDGISVQISQLRENLFGELNKRTEIFDRKIDNKIDSRIDDIEHTFTKGLARKIERIETGYASNLQRIEDVLTALEGEYQQASTSAMLVSDFLRYNKFRLALMRLLAGDRKVVHLGLSLILSEYVPNIQIFTAYYLRKLLVELKNAGRFSRSDLQELVGEVISSLDLRFPPADDGATDRAA